MGVRMGEEQGGWLGVSWWLMVKLGEGQEGWMKDRDGWRGGKVMKGGSWLDCEGSMRALPRGGG